MITIKRAIFTSQGTENKSSINEYKLEYLYTPEKTCTVRQKSDRYSTGLNHISVICLCCIGDHSTVPVHGTRDEELT